MNDLFPGLDGKTPEQVWGLLFIPGDEPKTWRLNVPEPLSAAQVSAEKPAVKPSVTVEFRRAENQPAEGLSEATVAGTTQMVYLHKSADATNVDIAEARAAVDNQQKPVVEITFTEEGAKKMAKLTAERQDKPLAILVDGKVVCAPVVRSTLSRVAQITGNFTQEEVDRIVRGINGQVDAQE
jgi:preprotein translocase subunit SecD